MRTAAAPKLVVTCAAGAMLIACALSGSPGVVSNVDAYAGAEALTKVVYSLLPLNEGVSEDDLQFREFATYADIILQSNGMRPAASGAPPEVFIFLGYGIGEPERTEQVYSLPMWGQTGVSSSTTTATAHSYGSSTTVNAKTNYTPTYGITGYSQHTKVSISYTRYLTMTAIDRAASEERRRAVEVWRTSIVSTGSTGDLRAIFPILAASALRLIGKNPGRRVVVTLDDYSPEVVWVKREVQRRSSPTSAARFAPPAATKPVADTPDGSIDVRP